MPPRQAVRRRGERRRRGRRGDRGSRTSSRRRARITPNSCALRMRSSWTFAPGNNMRAITREAARPAIMRPPEWFRRRLLKLAGARRICRRAPLSYQPACKPGSVWPASKPAGVTAIPLVRRLPGASSNLPEWLIRTDPAPRGRAIPIRFCSRWGLPCRRRCRRRGALLPHRFTLAAANTQRAAAVSSLWHCP